MPLCFSFSSLVLTIKLRSASPNLIFMPFQNNSRVYHVESSCSLIQVAVVYHWATGPFMYPAIMVIAFAVLLGRVSFQSSSHVLDSQMNVLSALLLLSQLWGLGTCTLFSFCSKKALSMVIKEFGVVRLEVLLGLGFWSCLIWQVFSSFLLQSWITSFSRLCSLSAMAARVPSMVILVPILSLYLHRIQPVLADVFLT